MKDKDDILSIDKYNLDDELDGQPKLYRKLADKLAKYKKALAESEARLTLIKAEAEKDIRRNPEIYGWMNPDKDPTEAFVKASVIMEKKVRQAGQDVIDAQYLVDQTAGLVTAAGQRKGMLEKTVDLWFSDYWAEKIDVEPHQRRALQRGNKKGGIKRKPKTEDE